MAFSSGDRPGEISARLALDVVAPSHTTSSKAYDVFINHRGPDVKRSLASIIYWWLESTGVKAFFDTESLEPGDDIPKELEDSIRSVSVHIAIFSKRYAQSAWCLNELLIMLETDVTIIPVFYDVKPCDLQHVAKGIYAEAFSKHEMDARYKPETLQKWKEALAKVSKRSGCEFEANSDQGKLIKSIVKSVHKEIQNKTLLAHHKELLNVAKHPVGLDATVKRFENMLESSKSRQTVHFVGIVGQGGSGKTTLAKQLYNQKRSLRQRSSFLFDVRDGSKNKQLCKMQQRLLGDISPGRTFTFDHISEGIPTLKKHLRFASVLIVLDDVDDVDQLDALLPGKEDFPDNSLIIVTARDSEVLLRWGGFGFSIFPMELLDLEHAKQLFCCHAFSKPVALPEFEDLVKRFVDACYGLPLSLKVFGQMVSGCLKTDWESKLESVLKKLPRGIVQVLKVSYDSLEKDDQQMFLDTACFFIGEKKSLAIEVWDGTGGGGQAGLRTLVNKCLVELDQHGRIRMHHHLRDLGKEIASETSPYRIWVANQINNIARHSEAPAQLRGIMAAKTQFAKIYPHQEFPTCSEHYPLPFEECMKKLLPKSNRGCKNPLELLVFAHDQLLSPKFAKLLMDLVWLRWFDFKHPCIPEWMSLKNLRVLEFCGALNLEDLWTDNAHNPPLQLTELTIAANSGHSFYRFPSSIRRLNCLKKMVLISLSGVEFGFSSLPEEFCELGNLEHLELRYCRALLSLPTRFGELKKLGYLDLYSCRGLTELPISFKQLIDLKYLDLSVCEELRIRPDILENMKNLEKLFFTGCRNLEELPHHITDQKSLRELHLEGTQLKEVPSRLYQLSELEILKIGSTLLTSIPASLYCFPVLIHLSIKGCSELVSLPNCINSFTRTQGGLAQLQHFCIESSKVSRLQLLSSSHLTNLQTLKISDCPISKLSLRPGSLINLKVISISLTFLTSISISEDCCPKLETLHLRKNADLEVIKVLPPSVQMIELVDCPRLEKIRRPSVRTNLNVSRCPKYTKW